MDTSGQAVLVTSGGSELGRATARRLASLDAKVTILDFDIARAMDDADADPNTGERRGIINTCPWPGGMASWGRRFMARLLCLPAVHEFSRAGIRVMAIAPGLFETAMTETLSAKVRTAIAATIPFPSRLGFAEGLRCWLSSSFVIRS
ncbi:MAG: NAD(P)-dependent dehydrogenase (short-subunit alcohol dehydrogenase family) [Paracoccaceae bacterium]|jgi:NAD(P)-dependent dehydrogenase (short-subunit alcohol dehydrogenase family)